MPDRSFRRRVRTTLRRKTGEPIMTQPVPAATDSARQPDRDALFSLSLAVLVLFASLGSIYLIHLHRVWRTARCAGALRRFDGPRLVFGKRLQHGQPDRDYRLRLERAAELAASDPHQPILLLGGVRRPGEISEAAAGGRYLSPLFASAQSRTELILEDRSRDTLANLRHARELLAAQNQPAPVLLISNRYHLARCALIATSLGLQHSLCAAEPEWRYHPSNLIQLLREAFFILWFTTGKAWVHLTRNRRMLARIT